MSNTEGSYAGVKDAWFNVSTATISMKKDEEASHKTQQNEADTSVKPKTVDTAAILEDQQTLIYNALMQIPMWKDLPRDIKVLLTELGSGFIQTCWVCQTERSTNNGKCSTFHCTSCKGVMDLLEELEEEQHREVYYDDQGNVIPQSWFNYSDSDYCENSYAEYEPW